jgi:hypothetical protein
MSKKKTESTEIKNRIVGSAEVDPKEIKANAKNWRKHPQAQRNALEGVLKEVGWVQEVIINRTTGSLIDGHLRVSLALEKKEPVIPVKYVELSEQEEMLILATIDPIAAMAVSDRALLEQLLAETTSSNEQVENLLTELKFREGLIDQIEQAPTLTDLEKEYGDNAEDDFWPKINIKVPPLTYDLFQSKMQQFTGKDHEKLLKVLESAI